MSDDTRLLATLSEREREVLVMVAEGLSLSDIAARLHRSRKTIQSHRLSIGRKLGLRNRVELTRLAIRVGLVSAGGSGGSVADKATPTGVAMPQASASEPVMFFLNPQGQVLYAPPSLLSLWRYSSEIQILSRPFQDLWLPSAEINSLILQLFGTGQWTGTLVGQRADQSLFQAQVQVTLVSNTSHQPVRWHGTVEYLRETPAPGSAPGPSGNTPGTPGSNPGMPLDE